MIGSTGVADAVLAEVCKTDPAQSVFVLPSDNLRQRLCATDRVKLMKLAADLYRRINVSAVQREVCKL